MTSSFYKLNVAELSTMILRESPNSSERDAGFCSGSSEIDEDTSFIDQRTSNFSSSNLKLEQENHDHLDQPNSPTDASEDSVEVKVSAISNTRNKRKSTEPSRVVCGQHDISPLKKFIKYGEQFRKLEKNIIKSSLIRPDRNVQYSFNESRYYLEKFSNPAELLQRHPGVTTLHRNLKSSKINSQIQEEPLALIAKKTIKLSNITSNLKNFTTSHTKITTFTSTEKITKYDQTKLQSLCPLIERHKKKANYNFETNNDDLRSLDSNDNLQLSEPQNQQNLQRNYKNMTRERRIEANARERTRVHTISAAYDTLRKSVPAYSNSQKLSKLSVLRVACSYILTLSRLAGYDYSEDQSSPSLASCVEMVTKTIQTESKTRKKKDD